MKKNIEEIQEEDWKVVEERLESMSDDLKLGILGESLTKKELINEIKKRSEVGIAYAEMQLDFIRWLIKQSKIV